MKLAVFLPNWIGDVVMATPALRAVRTRFPQAEILGVMRPYVADVLAGTGLLDRHLFYDPRSKDRHLSGRAVIGKLRADKPDAALLLTNSFRTAWLAWRSGAKRRVGFARDGRGWLLTDRVKPKPKSRPHPVLDEYLRLAEAMGCKELSPRMELATTDEDEQAHEEFWAEKDWHLQAAGVVALNPGGAFGSAKHWPAEHFAGLARRISDDLETTVLVLCGPAERETAREIVRLADRDNVLSLAEAEPSLGLSKAAVKHSRLLVTTDSGPRHFAQPFGVPVVTLFGPTHVAWSDTHDDRAVHLQLDLDCGPCQQRTCPLKHHRCMRDLSVDQVYAAVESVIFGAGREAA